MTRFAGVLIALLAAACGGDGPAAPSPSAAAPSSFEQHPSTHFVFHHTTVDTATIANTAAIVEAEYARIISDLHVASMPQVAVFLYPDRHSMQESVRPIVGTLPAGAKGLVTSVDRIHILSPSLAGEWSYADGTRAIVHEFAHCVSMRVNPTIPNNPRWLWETIAVYEAGQFVHPGTVPALMRGQPPTLANLSGFDNTDVYRVGYLIAEFIVMRWGGDTFVALIRSNGNTAHTLGLGEAEFISQWQTFVRDRYGL